MISPIKPWEALGNELGTPGKDLKTRLKLVVDRRNKIAHEADLDPTSPGFRWPIDASIAKDTVDFVETLADAIYKLCA